MAAVTRDVGLRQCFAIARILAPNHGIFPVREPRNSPNGGDQDDRSVYVGRGDVDRSTIPFRALDILEIRVCSRLVVSGSWPEYDNGLHPEFASCGGVSDLWMV